MPKLFSSNEKKFLTQIDKSEKELNRFICDNWNDLFPNYVLIKSEFPLKGNVRSLGTNGRIDILAYNPETKKFIVFELKRDYDRNITDQAADYRDYVQDNFSDVYLHSTQKYDIALPKFVEINQNAIEIILLAKKFSLTQIDRVKKIKEGSITLIKYYWFENDLIFIDYINNDPDDIKIETANTKKINEIKNIIAKDPELLEIDKFFGILTTGRDVFLTFLNFLKENGEVNLAIQQSKIRVTIDGQTFSSVKCGGKGARKAVLQINTNIDISELDKEIQTDDRDRGKGVKMKGSLGIERYEVFFRNDDEIKMFCNYIKGKLWTNGGLILS